jgi:hypothetical protein
MTERRETPQIAWYEELRGRWKPSKVRLLLVGGSAPDPGSAERRFFYAETLDRRDNLFRGVVAALYEPIPRGSSGQVKEPWLRRLRDDGVFLVDLVPFPVNKFSGRDRRGARREHVPALISEALGLAPAGVIVCHEPTFDDVAVAMLDAGLPLLHDAALPFPLGNMRGRFVAGVRDALGAAR